jgi:hypothetical protein
MLVDEAPVRRVRVRRPVCKIHVRVAAVLTQLVPRGERTRNHIIDAPLGHTPVPDRLDEVRTPPAIDGRGGVRLVLISLPVRFETGHVHIAPCERRLHAIDHRGPIGDDWPLEVELLFDEPVQDLRVLARLSLVELIVRAHDGRHAGVDGLGEWPEVELVNRPVINVRGRNLLRLPAAAEVLLLVPDEVLSSPCELIRLSTERDVKTNLRVRHDARALNAQDRLRTGDTRKIGICTKSLPITSTSGDTNQVHHRSELNVDPLAAMFPAHRLAAGIDEGPVPGRRRVDASRARGSVNGPKQTSEKEEWTYKAEVKSARRTPRGESSRQRPFHPKRGIVYIKFVSSFISGEKTCTYSRVTDTATVDVRTGCDVDLLLEGELRHERARLGRRSSPTAIAGDVLRWYDDLRDPLFIPGRRSVGYARDHIRGNERERKQQRGEP